ncbi:hypothetical protein TNCV_5073261 [Trichonephila clavipes]|nr:hypothetical protein TNCV_5073261 [Trichonephila clavipes]
MAHEHRSWRADWHQVVFSEESRFNLWDHDGCNCTGDDMQDGCIYQQSGTTDSVRALSSPAQIRKPNQ